MQSSMQACHGHAAPGSIKSRTDGTAVRQLSEYHVNTEYMRPLVKACLKISFRCYLPVGAGLCTRKGFAHHCWCNQHEQTIGVARAMLLTLCVLMLLASSTAGEHVVDAAVIGKAPVDSQLSEVQHNSSSKDTIPRSIPILTSKRSVASIDTTRWVVMVYLWCCK